MTALKNAIQGAEKGIRFALPDIMKLFDQLAKVTCGCPSRSPVHSTAFPLFSPDVRASSQQQKQQDRIALVRIALAEVILFTSQYVHDGNKTHPIPHFMPIIKKNIMVKQISVRFAYGTLLGKLIAQCVPTDATAARKNARTVTEDGKISTGGGKGDGNDRGGSEGGKGNFGKRIQLGKSDAEKANEDLTLANSIIDFESGFAAALTWFNKSCVPLSPSLSSFLFFSFVCPSESESEKGTTQQKTNKQNT